MKISVVIITQNERDNLPRCLESIKWADEIIVVDSGSTDGTVDIAKNSGAVVFENQWKGYGAQKNLGINKTTGDWVLSIDADEAAVPELQDEIRATAENPCGHDAFRLRRKLMFQGKFLRCSYPGWQIRFFRKGKAKFSDDLVHEKLVVDGNIGSLKNGLLHYSYKNLSKYFERFNLYTSLDAKKRFAANKKFHFRYYAYPLIKFFKLYFLKFCFLDGLQGFNWAILSALYDFIKFQKLKELWRNNAGK